MVESHGIPTVCLSINRAITERIAAPRSVFVKFPHGAAMGEPGNVEQQTTILRELLWAAQDLDEPGGVVEPGYRWRRSSYEPVDPASIQR